MWCRCQCAADSAVLDTKLDRILDALRIVILNQGKIMSDQDTLNTLAASFKTALDTIATEIATLQQQQNSGQPLDFTAINAALVEAQQIATPAPAAPSGDAPAAA